MRALGAIYEQRAQYFLEQHGLTLLSKNSQYRSGEIDLIMQDKSCVVFVEVRYRQHDYFGDAASTITLKKQQKLMATAARWLLEHYQTVEDVEYRFDVIAITGEQLQWLTNVFFNE